MVILKLQGGLGNQMFQYSTGRALAARWNTELRFDLSFYATQDKRAYLLPYFRIHGQSINESEAADLRAALQLRGIRSSLARLLGIRRRMAVFRAQQVPFEPRFLDLPEHVYLDGYFQSEKYFAPVAETIRGEFQLKDALSSDRQRLTDELSNSLSVGVHVRRGDYVAESNASQTHGVCSVEYYKRCAAIVREVAPRASFFVFSDDIDWAQMHLDFLPSVRWVSGQDKLTDYEELHVMSHCRHFIIANSSFSWWAAWLGMAPDKIVCAPERWFTDQQYDARDICPSGWQKVPS